MFINFNNMKKPILQKTISFLIVAFAVLLIAGCGNKTKIIDSNSNQKMDIDTTGENIINQANNNDTINQQKEQLYLDEAKKIIKDFSDSLNYFAKLLDEKPLYSSWSENEKAIGALSSVTIEQAYDRAAKLSPPDKFVESHSILLQSLKKYKQAMPLFRQGMDESNKQKINQSTVLMTEGASLLRQATAVINK